MNKTFVTFFAKYFWHREQLENHVDGKLKFYSKNPSTKLLIGSVTKLYSQQRIQADEVLV